MTCAPPLDSDEYSPLPSPHSVSLAEQGQKVGSKTDKHSSRQCCTGGALSSGENNDAASASPAVPQGVVDQREKERKARAEAAARRQQQGSGSSSVKEVMEAPCRSG